MIRIAVLASTSGSDLPALLAPSEHFTLSLIVCNKECGAFEQALAHDIPRELMLSRGSDRTRYDEQLTALLEEHRIDLVVLIGWMRIFSPEFVERWRNKVMNIHPSLLPAFAGAMDLDVHAAVLERGCKISGCTLHFIDEGADTGPIILQRSLDIAKDETAGTLKGRIQELEREAIRTGVELYAQGKISIEGSKVRIA